MKAHRRTAGSSLSGDVETGGGGAWYLLNTFQGPEISVAENYQPKVFDHFTLLSGIGARLVSIQ